MIDTSRVTRRTLRFERPEDVLREVDRIVAAEKSGTLKRNGNWTTGQIFNHVASWILYSYEGYPMKQPPWLLRIIIRWKFKQFLRRGMDGGVKIPGVQHGTYGTEDMPTEQAAAKLRTALKRLGSEPCKFDSPAIGPMSNEDRVRVHMRHAELHMGYLSY